ncbi:hypothetical protein QF037_009226 [Streptomyces canus]|nr:hypothetical protein [Streptomyces canus]
MSSSSEDRHRERRLFIEQSPRLEAVKELAEHPMEQVPESGRMEVTAGPAAPVVGIRAAGGGQGGEGPEKARVVQAVVLDPSAADVVVLAGGPGDGGRARVRLQPTGVVESRPVVADLGEDAGAELGAQARKAQHHLGVGVFAERLLGRFSEFVDRVAGRVELPQQSEHLLAQGLLDELRVTGLRLRSASASMPLTRPARFRAVHSLFRLVPAEAVHSLFRLVPAALPGAGATTRIARVSGRHSPFCQPATASKAAG